MIKKAFVATLLVVLSACGTVSNWLFGDPSLSRLRSLTISTDVAANSGNATMLDIVFVYADSASPLLPKTGPAWFAQKDALKTSLASAIEVVSLQVPAGAPDFQVKLPAKAAKAVAVYALANYLSVQGQPIANLTAWREATVRLLPATISFSGK